MTERRRGPGLVGLGVVVLVVAVGAVLIGMMTEGGTARGVIATGGDPEMGRGALLEYGCAACHRVPGLRHPETRVGPPLDAWSERTHVAGRLANTPENLVEWIIDPQGIDPGNAMPDLGVPESTARDMAAYLYTLGNGGGP
jgi:cytochrome c